MRARRYDPEKDSLKCLFSELLEYRHVSELCVPLAEVCDFETLL